ncbi:brevican core protein-like [Syngnathus typhle]|uniref:brevican core protein-like n=1 Tax=Syngnathus typhle TaxID=161592 RepID=UPI002A6A45C7|nr:brevican core protein-like [Syngnathus typhle]
MIHQRKEFFFLLLLCFPLSRGQSECPTGWLEHGGKCYYFSSDTKTWKEANAFCLSHDSKLTSILDADEKDWLRTTFRQGKAWLGLTDEHEEGVWSWTDKSLFTESMANWGEDLPNNYGGGKRGAHCAAMVTRLEGRWFDYDCDSSTANYICKRANLESIVAPKENQVLEMGEEQAPEPVDQIVMVPKGNQELDVNEQLAVELVTQMAIVGKVVPKPEEASKTETKPCSPGDVRCSRQVILKPNSYFGKASLVGELVGGLKTGNVIIVKGKFRPNAKRFSINLDGNGDLLAFHMDIRFDYLSDKRVVVCNSYVSGIWGREARQLTSFPFVPGQSFEIRIRCDANSFHLTLNGDAQLDYKYRFGLDQIKRVRLLRDGTQTDITLM